MKTQKADKNEDVWSMNDIIYDIRMPIETWKLATFN